MKLIKFGILAAVATLLLGAFSAKAVVFTLVTNYSKLNISFVITTNKDDVDNGKVTKYPTGTVKITNKQLLELFAEWDGTTWPAGAQLVQGWDEAWDGHVLVVDKTGTNVLYDAYGDGSTFSFQFVCESYEGSLSGTASDSDPGTASYVESNYGFVELVDHGHVLSYTDISAYGACAEKFSDSWDSNHVYTKWSDSEKFTATFADQYFLNNLQTSYSVEVSSSGHGTGLPSLFN